MTRRFPTRRTPSPVAGQKPIISRAELPIVQRGDNAGGALRILLLVLLVFAAVFYGPKLLKFDQLHFGSNTDFRIESVNVAQQSTGKVSIWLVTGLLVNPATEERAASDLEVRLVRADGSLVARSVVPMNSQMLPANGGVRFQARLTGSGSDPVTADIRPIRPAADPTP